MNKWDRMLPEEKRRLIHQTLAEEFELTAEEVSQRTGLTVQCCLAFLGAMYNEQAVVRDGPLWRLR